MRILLLAFAAFSLWEGTAAIQCLSCSADARSGRYCRSISEAKGINCASDVDTCTALVFVKNGVVHVNRGCGGAVASWGFGDSECDILDDKQLKSVGVALYQCRGDLCNNLEPSEQRGAEVVLSLAAVGQPEEAPKKPSPSVSKEASRNTVAELASNEEEEEVAEESSKPSQPAAAKQPGKAENNLPKSSGGLDVASNKMAYLTTKRTTRKRPSYGAELISEETEDSQADIPTTKATTTTTSTTRRTTTTTRPTTTTTKPTTTTTRTTTTPTTTTTRTTTTPTTTTKKTTTRATSTTTPTTKIRTTTAAEEEEEEEEQSYGRPPTTTRTTTTTTTTKKRPSYGGEQELMGESVDEIRVTLARTQRPRRTVFDRRR